MRFGQHAALCPLQSSLGRALERPLLLANSASSEPVGEVTLPTPSDPTTLLQRGSADDWQFVCRQANADPRRVVLGGVRSGTDTQAVQRGDTRHDWLLLARRMIYKLTWPEHNRFSHRPLVCERHHHGACSSSRRIFRSTLAVTGRSSSVSAARRISFISVW